MGRPTNHISPRGFAANVRHYLGDMVYGANDGLLTTFAAVAAVEGGRLTAATVLVVGIANLIADGLSMGIGNYLAIQAREQTRAAEDLPEEESQPIRHGIATFAAFVVAGAAPLLPYLAPFDQTVARGASIVVTLISLFLVGASRGVVTGRSYWPGGLQALGLGIAAGAVAYAAGGIVAAAVGTP